MQKGDMNISLTAIGALWTTADFFARGVNHDSSCKAIVLRMFPSTHFEFEYFSPGRAYVLPD